VSGAALDRLLALLLAAQMTTGLLSLRAGVPATAALFWAHGLLGGALLVAVVLKLRRSGPPAVRHRRWARLALAALVTLLASASVVGGFAWVASGRLLSIGPWTVLTLHVWAALALVPILAIHLLPRRWRVLRLPSGRLNPSRRTFLASVGVLGVGAVAWGAANLLDALLGGARRFTGSRWLPQGGVPPPTTFYGEGPPSIDVVAWRLAVNGAVGRELRLDMGSLRALGEVERDAVLDCTSGWAMRTTWGGVPLRALLEAAGATVRNGVEVRSATGWSVRLDPHEVEDALLAMTVAGQPLPAANGAPCRLVAPTRRGLDWIKWVTEVRVA
jgi:hypothetical protein